ncbi:MAG: hypothetical protein MUE73_05010 [Planctomycetes bacterium]|nr:hypothetical protein [Planctomycetota bacterium]
MAWPDLTGVLSPLPWAVVGAAATRLYMPERATRDLDVAVRAGDARDVRDRLSRAGFTQLGELSIGGSSWRATDGAEIDVIEGREEWWDDALREAQANRDASGLPILPLRHLVLMKLRSGRVQDIADVARMLGQADPGALDAVRALFRRYAPADLGDLESLAALGRLETEEPREPAI